VLLLVRIRGEESKAGFDVYSEAKTTPTRGITRNKKYTKCDKNNQN
jgi:hypothetical protein